MSMRRFCLPCVLFVVCLLSIGGRENSAAGASASATAPTEAIEQAQEPVTFVWYVKSELGGRMSATAYYPGEDRSVVVATSTAWGLPPRIHDLPLRGVLTFRLPYDDPAYEQPVYFERVTGQLLHPNHRLRLGRDPHRVLLDLVGERALVAELEPPGQGQATARLLLHRDDRLVELGRVWMEQRGSGPDPRMIEPHHALSPDRDHLIWEGPEGTFEADLETGEVRPGEARSSDKYDERGHSTFWRYDYGRWTQKTQPSDYDRLRAESGKDIWLISPGGTYWAFRRQDPAGGPPATVQVAPGRAPSMTERVARLPWAINGTEVFLWTVPEHWGPERIPHRDGLVGTG